MQDETFALAFRINKTGEELEPQHTVGSEHRRVSQDGPHHENVDTDLEESEITCEKPTSVPSSSSLDQISFSSFGTSRTRNT